MSKDPAFLFYSKDWIEGTAELFPEEKGVYIDLISHQHQKGELPKDKRRLARLVGLDLESFSKIWENIKDKFIESDSGFINQRIAKETAKRSLSGVKKSCLAVYGNWIKGNSDISQSLLKAIKDTFSLDDFTGISDEEKRKKSIINHLEKRKDELLANAKRTHIANGNAIANENANKNVDDIEVENEKMKNEKAEIIFPFDDENFKTQWQHWKIYKAKELKFKYKTIQSEQAALNELANKAKGDEKTAIAIMHQSMANGWKGFFELKNKTNAINKGFEADNDYHKKVYESEIANTWNK